MSGILESVLFSVCRLRATFDDGLGNPQKIICGSGFWISDNTMPIFITNKHNVDPKLKLGPDTPFGLKTLEIELRILDGNSPSKKTIFCHILDLDQSLFKADTADVALIYNPSIRRPKDNDYDTDHFIKLGEIADSEFLMNRVAIVDMASFIGYPGTSKSNWWDEQYNIGIARSVNIASRPGIPFSNSQIPTKDVCLVSGLSFSGSSGSVVISHEKGVRLGKGLTGPPYVPPKIIGIMSGHWWEPGSEPDMFSHSGLSYFTRSTSIIDLIETIGGQ